MVHTSEPYKDLNTSAEHLASTGYGGHMRCVQGFKYIGDG